MASPFFPSSVRDPTYHRYAGAYAKPSVAVYVDLPVKPGDPAVSSVYNSLINSFFASESPCDELELIMADRASAGRSESLVSPINYLPMDHVDLKHLSESGLSPCPVRVREQSLTSERRLLRCGSSSH